MTVEQSIANQQIRKETDTDEVLVQVKNIKKYFPIKGGILKRDIGQVKAVDDVSLEVKKGETLGLVGESGSGKSTLGRVILRLLQPTEGEILFEDNDISLLSNRKLREYRKDMQIVFQDPYASLNSKMSVGELIEEPLLVQTSASKSERKEKAIELLEKVGMRASDRTKYPHEFSGGQRQRISIARALALNPKFIICDEPVSALDVSIQAQVLNLMADLQDEFNLTYLFIAHDLSVVKHISDRVAVMYLGRIAEVAPKKSLYDNPLHPYTTALLSSVPSTDVRHRREKIQLSGDLPSPSDPPSGCVFRTRCPQAYDRCSVERPELKDMGAGHYVACHLYDEAKT
ncbi:peptide/nickel transport system ATP-binding protein/oligopeptide transport system ATP-binding protein [Virgibacillus natechei]|uniref:Peptide/nickel transport system ATP-binding protein/oligopeptide transport system ATP-binding protein n=1 Tax=Virgibacillus natechei TaxID=1216297 RepID=A0ABS4IHM7_9BACI|nr:dipeptide ABC transporter ATP-binding protein [Virgibacillus natechei]MBP1970459.1 peptide/nickel transport system ATP-binding protein/oligopeptide transport system ATP-binding protein [Virgibacillus natechei]UZD13892.1 dipeptide ABC transporter ATP-binding protein [Virgibacillus natechei]